MPDGIWFFEQPDVDFEVQIESSPHRAVLGNLKRKREGSLRARVLPEKSPSPLDSRSDQEAWPSCFGSAHPGALG